MYPHIPKKKKKGVSSAIVLHMHPKNYVDTKGMKD
jgi:L,D-peptidoglycan transpeptidase YkuD (ErfK/YbiS/YcfS/YnhG family)